MKSVLFILLTSLSVVAQIQSPASRLEALARANFPDIAEFPAELDLVQKVTTGEVADRGQDLPWHSESDNADTPSHKWGREREVRAKVIRWLSVGRDTREFVDPRGIRLAGGRILGDLDLSFANIPFPVWFVRCKLESLDLNGATVPSVNLSGSWGTQILASTARITQALSLGAFRADGQVNLVRAQIGDLQCDAATITRFGLFANGVAIDGNASFAAFPIGGSVPPVPFHVNGPLNLEYAKIGGGLNLTGGEFINPTGNAIDLVGSTVKGPVFFFTASGPQRQAQYLDVRGAIDLRTATVGGIYLDQLHWPPAWLLEDLIYDKIYLQTTAFIGSWRYGLAPNAQQGLAWLALDGSGSIQPYEQLAKVFDSFGDAHGARQIREMMESKLSERNDSWPIRRLKNAIGYGYEPENAIWGLGLVTVIGWLVYWGSYRMSKMVPTDKEAFDSMKSGGQLPQHYPRLSALIYSLENTFPLVKLGQVEKWQPDTHLIRWFRWFQILIGWLLAALFAAGIAHLVQSH